MHSDKLYSILDDTLKQKAFCTHDKKYKTVTEEEICAECGETILPFTDL